MKCSFRPSHCRRLSRRSKSPANCSKSVDGRSVGGRTVRAHSRPKGCADPAVLKLQAAARRISAQRRRTKQLSAAKTLQAAARRISARKRAKASKTSAKKAKRPMSTNLPMSAKKIPFELHPHTKAFTDPDDLKDRDAAAFGLAHFHDPFPASVDAEMRALLSLPTASEYKPHSSDPLAYPRGTKTEMPSLLRLCFWIGVRLNAQKKYSQGKTAADYANAVVKRDCHQYEVDRFRESSIETLSRQLVYGVLRNCIVPVKPNNAYKHSFSYKHAVEWEKKHGYPTVAQEYSAADVRRLERTLMVLTFGTESVTFLNQLGVFMEVCRLALQATA